MRLVLSTDAAYQATDVEFDADGTTLRGWLYGPRDGAAAASAVVMAHGYNCIESAANLLTLSHALTHVRVEGRKADRSYPTVSHVC
jgi:hypothetical protein